MSRLFNDPADFLDELVEGFVAASGRRVRAVPGGVVRSTGPADVPPPGTGSRPRRYVGHRRTREQVCSALRRPSPLQRFGPVGADATGRPGGPLQEGRPEMLLPDARAALPDTDTRLLPRGA